MKGITPVIAVILLLLVTIAIVGFASGFFQRIFGIAGAGVETETSSVIQRTAQTVKIDNVDPAGSKIDVRNIGTANIIAATEISVFLSGTKATCAWSAATLTPGGTSTCTYSGVSCTKGDGKVVKVVAPGNEATDKC